MRCGEAPISRLAGPAGISAGDGGVEMTTTAMIVMELGSDWPGLVGDLDESRRSWPR